jgi:hypothetical protein
MARRRFVGLVAVLALAGAVDAQQPTKPAAGGDPQSTVEPRSDPGAGQKFLARFVGEWDVAKAFYPRSGGEPARTRGICRQTMIHGGRFLQSDFEFGNGPSKSTGLGLIGFEPATGKFTSVWTDSRQTRMSFRQARERFDGRRIVLYSETLGGDPQGRLSRTVTELSEDGNRIVHRQYGVAADGQERLVMELVMTRKPATTAR